MIFICSLYLFPFLAKLNIPFISLFVDIMEVTKITSQILCHIRDMSINSLNGNYDYDSMYLSHSIFLLGCSE